MFYFLYILLLGVDIKEDNRTTQEILPLTLVTLGQPLSKVKSLDYYHGNMVPIAEAESDLETPDNDEEEEDEEEETQSHVNILLFYSVLFYSMLDHILLCSRIFYSFVAFNLKRNSFRSTSYKTNFS